MKHKWWHGFFVIYLGRKTITETANFYGAKPDYILDETHIYCPLCRVKIVENHLLK